MTPKKTEKPKLSISGDVDDILRMAYGGKVPDKQNMADGGMAQGPSHEQGGIEVQDQQGTPIAEIEGNERVFSQEDTAAIEEAAMQIIELTQAGQEDQANDLAMRLGYAVVNMIAAQEQNQEAQEQQMSARAANQQASEAEAMNTFENTPDEYQ